MNPDIIKLLYEALETEIGGIEIYTNAVASARNSDLKEEWKKYLQQTKRHEEILREVFETLGLDAEEETPGRQVVRHIGESLVQAIQKAQKGGDSDAAQIVAAECVVLAETKDHMNWELIGEIAKTLEGEEKKALSDAHDEVEDEEDEHLYHTQGWTRELWMRNLGLPAVIPPPEEKRDVKTAIGAALAKKARTFLSKSDKSGKKSAARAPRRARTQTRRRTTARPRRSRRAAR
jgi:rubrerythrin